MNILKQARNRIGLSQVQMALRLGLSVRTIYCYESKERHIKICDMLKVSKAYRLTDVEILKYLEQVDR